jgi:1-acyl-sn-glycerol-3-phosphate acyltransferase
MRIKNMSVTATGLAQQGAVWIFSASYLPALMASCLLTNQTQRNRVGPRMARGWGWMVSRLAGVRIQYTPAARQALDTRKARVLTFNHGSTLDVPVGAALLPEGGVLAIKAEMRALPLLGPACAALGSIFLDRGDRESAYASLKVSARRIQDEKLQVLIAPEGTRSPDGQLGQFKLGAFHLAFVAEAPILPLVLHNSAAIWPRGQIAPNGGTVIIDALPEVHMPAGDSDALRSQADALRTLYQKALLAGPSVAH